MNRTVLVIGIIFLLAGVSINPAVAFLNRDDTTPPVSTHSLDPLEPDGCNGWYVSDVNVTLTAIDDMSGVKEIKYKVQDGATQTINGDNGTFILTQYDDGDNVTIEYWAIDNVGNEENHHTFCIDMDQTDPVIDLIYEITGGNPWQGWDFLFTATATDITSGMERVEFYLNDELQSIVNGPGPCYLWDWYYDGSLYSKLRILGLILSSKITEDYITFFALMVSVSGIGYPNIDIYAKAYDNAGNSAIDMIESPKPQETLKPGIYLFKIITLPNNYVGKIGLFFINAIFDITPFENAAIAVEGTEDQIKLLLASGGDNYGDGYVIADDVRIFIDGIKVSKYETIVWKVGGIILLGDTDSGSWEEGETCEPGDYEVTVSIKDTVVFDGAITVG